MKHNWFSSIYETTEDDIVSGMFQLFASTHKMAWVVFHYWLRYSYTSTSHLDWSSSWCIHKNSEIAIVHLLKSPIIPHFTNTIISTWISEASINFLFTSITMVTRCAFTGEIFEFHNMTSSTMLARIIVAGITFG